MKKIVLDIETLGLEPRDDRILSIGVMDIDTQKTKIFINIEERLTLEEFWAYVKDVQEFWTFNGDGFDIPYLIRRSLINNVKISNLMTIHSDLRKIVNGFWYSYEKFGKGTLRDWALVLGITCETCPGNEMPALFVKGDFEAIIKHNTEDLILTHKLYARAKECGLIK